MAHPKVAGARLRLRYRATRPAVTSKLSVDNYAEFQRLGVEIYSVSTDSHFTHKAWHASSETIGKIEFPMIDDPTGAMTRNFSVMIEADGMADPCTSVIDPEGKSQLVEIKAAQYVEAHPNEVCPAKW